MVLPSSPDRRNDPPKGRLTPERNAVSEETFDNTSLHIGTLVDVNAAVTADVGMAVAPAPGLRLIGFSCRESAASPAAATFIIIHGSVAAGTALVPVELTLDESRVDWYGPDGLDVANGISIDWVAGTFDLHLFYKTLS